MSHRGPEWNPLRLQPTASDRTSPELKKQLEEDRQQIWTPLLDAQSKHYVRYQSIQNAIKITQEEFEHGDITKEYFHAHVKWLNGLSHDLADAIREAVRSELKETPSADWWRGLQSQSKHKEKLQILELAASEVFSGMGPFWVHDYFSVWSPLMKMGRLPDAFNSIQSRMSEVDNHLENEVDPRHLEQKKDLQQELHSMATAIGRLVDVAKSDQMSFWKAVRRGDEDAMHKLGLAAIKYKDGPRPGHRPPGPAIANSVNEKPLPLIPEENDDGDSGAQTLSDLEVEVSSRYRNRKPSTLRSSSSGPHGQRRPSNASRRRGSSRAGVTLDPGEDYGINFRHFSNDFDLDSEAMVLPKVLARPPRTSSLEKPPEKGPAFRKISYGGSAQRGMQFDDPPSPKNADGNDSDASRKDSEGDFWG
ncbi:hypothetical protein OIO90_003799 [Microbotryomycetes sp. JL221]|nr:hypothetical protein OIO90_003799 [Microbotryomycetes sp. JL221]